MRLEEAGIEPAFCLDHGMTLSYYYRDPDGNHVELQVDNFGDWAKSSAHMRESPEFAADPIGKFVDPARVAEAAAAGASFDRDPRPRDGGRALPGHPAARGAARRGLGPARLPREPPQTPFTETQPTKGSSNEPRLSLT